MNPSESSNPPTASEKSPEPDAASVKTMDDTDDIIKIPVIAETLSVGKQVIKTGEVQLTKTVHHDQQEVSVPLMAEHIEIERIPMDEFVDEVPTRQEGDTTIYPVLTEEYIVIKRLRLIEEIRVTKRQVQTTEKQIVSLRREEVVVRQIPVDETSERSDLPD